MWKNNPIKYIDPTGRVSEEDVSNVIKNNATNIKNASQKYD